MRVAAIYDIHGNLPALIAVLADIQEAAPELIIVGGDVASGPMPKETMDVLVSLGETARFIRGNADRELVRLFESQSSLRQIVGAADVWVQRDAWAAQQLTRAHCDFLAGLPDTLVLAVDGLGPTLFCHGSPRSDEEIVTRVTPEQRLAEILVGVPQAVVVCGHTHVQFDRTHSGKRIVNAGSVGMPYERETGAYWVLLGPDVTLRRTEYNVEKAAKLLGATDFPQSGEFAGDLLRPPDPDATSEYFEKVAEERARLV